MARKTIAKWFAELPEPIQSKAISNCKPYTLALVKKSMQDALDSFIWEKSNEGYNYWFHKWTEYA